MRHLANSRRHNDMEALLKLIIIFQVNFLRLNQNCLPVPTNPVVVIQSLSHISATASSTVATLFNLLIPLCFRLASVTVKSITNQIEC